HVLFFFQAEDGIRDFHVTGVQTCALPILFLLPTIIGALTVYLSSQEKVQSIAYRIFAPWGTIFLFLLITLVLSIEGWACWLMILPVFLVTASIGGMFGGYLKNQKKNDRLNISI